jgi:anti-sigma-K factor RskA
MISDDLQDQAALYVLGSLDADETAAFEGSLRDDTELRALVRDLREAAGYVGRSLPATQPPAELKRRVLREIALEKQARSQTDRCGCQLAAMGDRRRVDRLLCNSGG